MAKPENPFLRGRDLPAPFLATGHRGARAYAPENTLASLELAADLGAAMVEVDVHLTRDLVPVVFHDGLLSRCTDVVARFPERSPWYLTEFDLEDLQELDAGSWFVAKPLGLRGATEAERVRFLTPAVLARFGAGRVRIPTLEEVLLAMEARGVYVNVELKAVPDFQPGLGEAVLEVIRRLGHEHRVLLSCFDHSMVRDLKRAAPAVATGVLSCERFADPVRYLVELVGADALHPRGRRGVDALGLTHHQRYGGDMVGPLVRELHAAGLRVFAWTVDDPEDIEYFRAAGVDGIMSDFPDRLVRQIG